MLEDKICIECGETFTPTNHKQKCCCRNCNVRRWRKTKKGNYLKKCSECGKEFKANSTGQKYCSKECKSPNISGKNHSRYIDGIGWYKTTLKDSCEVCGSDSHLCVHHKDRNRHNNVEDNLITLCRSCHAKEHKLIENITKKG